MPWSQTSPMDQTMQVVAEYLRHLLCMTAGRLEARGKVSLQEASDGPAVFVMLRESGHAIFDLLKVPILGREEDAADTFAAVVLLRARQDVALRTLRGAAWAYLNEASSRTPNEGDFADIHGLDSQRYYNILCMAYGSDPKYFAGAVTDRHLPAKRAEGCGAEYHQALFAFQKLILLSVDTEALERLRIKHQNDWNGEPWANTFPVASARLGQPSTQPSFACRPSKKDRRPWLPPAPSRHHCRPSP